jgi:hypothetical protein
MTHKPSDQTRRTVESVAGFGVPQPDIARLIGVSLGRRSERDSAAGEAGSLEALTVPANDAGRDFFGPPSRHRSQRAKNKAAQAPARRRFRAIIFGGRFPGTGLAPKREARKRKARGARGDL